MHSLSPFDTTESSKEQFAYTNIAEELVKLFKKQIEHDKKEMIFEVLAPLAENGKKERKKQFARKENLVKLCLFDPGR